MWRKLLACQWRKLLACDLIFTSVASRMLTPPAGKQDAYSTLFTAELIEFVERLIAFTTSGFEVEYQILHVQTQLAEGFLYER